MTLTLASRRTASLVPLVLGGLLLTGLAVAGPAAAIDDPRRPSATVVRGPSCGAGALRVQVVNGTEPHRVGLVLDGSDEHDAAALLPGEDAELRTADVAWGATVDVSVSVTSAEGEPGRPLELGTYSRPSREDCAPVGPAGSGAGTTVVRTSAAGRAGLAPTAPTSSPSSTLPSSTSPSSMAVGDAPDVVVRGPAVAPGGVITVRATGFTPGEPVEVSVPGRNAPPATVTAAPDGTVETVVQIPRSTQLGPLTVQLVGRDSARTSGLDLRVAAAQGAAPSPVPPVPVLAAGGALLAAGAALGSYAARRPRADADGVRPRRG